MGTPTLGSVGHATRRVMKSVMTKKLGAALNWAGQRGVKTGLVAYRHIVFGIAGKNVATTVVADRFFHLRNTSCFFKFP